MACEFEGKLATYYDYWATGPGDDVEFYVEEALRAGGPVLEIACGTGRIVIPIAEAGVEILGLDISTTMLSVAREKVAGLDGAVRRRIQLVQGDMACFDLGPRFKLITIPYRSFLAMLTPEAQRSCLACAREHLDADGRLILSFFDPRLDIIASGIGAPLRVEERMFTDTATGREVVMSTTARYAPEEQRIDVGCHFVESDGGDVVETSDCPFTLRWIYRWEMQCLLELSGFEVEALHGDFRRGPFRYGGEQIWVARKAVENNA